VLAAADEVGEHADLALCTVPRVNRTVARWFGALLIATGISGFVVPVGHSFIGPALVVLGSKKS
jgi:hypothetical protein